MNPPLVEIKNVTFAYNGPTVLQKIDLEIIEGDYIAMIGPNGGGKTTLLKLILGLLQPDSGTIRVMGQPAIKAAPQIGYVPQDVHINRSFPITAIDVVKMGLLSPRKRWHTRSSHRQEATAALDRLGVASLADSKMGSLSGGQRQRVFIARALATKPRLMLLDEPTASIDTRGQADFFKLLETLNRDVAILVVSHDLLTISRHAKSVACVNRQLHYHNQAEITGDMMESMYPGTPGETCPVELVAHGLPHRVLKKHKRE
jgi:zinc transport system ATP-binding protein